MITILSPLFISTCTINRYRLHLDFIFCFLDMFWIEIIKPCYDPFWYRVQILLFCVLFVSSYISAVLVGGV